MTTMCRLCYNMYTDKDADADGPTEHNDAYDYADADAAQPSKQNKLHDQRNLRSSWSEQNPGKLP